MTTVNQYLPFADGVTANTLTPAAYAALTSLLGGGFQTGTASSQQINTVLRQTTAVAAMIGQFIVNEGAVSANDDNNQSELLANFLTALSACIETNSPPSWSAVGFELSNDGSSPLTVLDIGKGQCVAVNTHPGTQIWSLTNFTKSLSTWAAGSGNGGLGPGLTLAANTWYHVFAAIVAESVDFFFDTVTSSPTHTPPGLTDSHYIGSILTDSSSNIVPFHQLGNEFLWDSPISNLATSSPATSATLVAVTVPPEILSQPIIMASITSTTPGDTLTISSGVVAAATSGVVVAQVSTVANKMVARSVSNSLSEVYYAASDSSSTVALYTLGYVNPNVGSLAGVD